MRMLTSLKNFSHAFTTALADGGVHAYFQPVVSTHNTRTVGFEVLARWSDPKLGTISPTIFIPLAEHAGLLDLLLECLMKQAFLASKAWPDDLRLAFNVSPAQLRNLDFPERFQNIAHDANFPLSRLRIEITESAIIEDEARAKTMLERIAALGCSVAMDDFGTGHASLTWLRTLPFDAIKLDTTFVRAMMEHRQSRKIVTAVVGLGQSLELKVIAEGVETEEEARFLRRIGCSHLQGFFFGPPMPAGDVPTHLERMLDLQDTSPLANLTFEQRAAQLSSLYQAPETSIGFLDTDFVIVDASKSFAQRFFLSVEEMIGRSIYELAPAALAIAPVLRTYRERGLPYPSFEFACPDGRTDLVTLSQVKDEAGELIGFCLLGMDISKKKLN